MTNLTFVIEGNSNQITILFLSYRIIAQFGRSLRTPSKLGNYERNLFDKKTIKIIDKKGVKHSIKSFFEGDDNTSHLHYELQADQQVLELFVFIAFNFQLKEDSELYKMSLECEPRQAK